MDKIKEFFDNHKDEFDEFEIPKGHERKFLKKLGKEHKTIGLKMWYGIAASFIFLAMFSFFAKDFIFKGQFLKTNQEQILKLSDISPKYQEVEAFYKAGVKSKINEFDKLNCKINNEQKLMIDKELNQLDVNYKVLQDELLKNRNDERIINAMIDNYQNKIDFLELVINQIKQNC